MFRALFAVAMLTGCVSSPSDRLARELAERTELSGQILTVFAGADDRQIALVTAAGNRKCIEREKFFRTQLSRARQRAIRPAADGPPPIGGRRRQS